MGVATTYSVPDIACRDRLLYHLKDARSPTEHTERH